MYDAMGIISKETKKEAITVFEEALENVTPSMEVKSRRIGGANYQTPIECLLQESSCMRIKSERVPCR